MNRMLVERTTQPLALDHLTDELEKRNPSWRCVRQDMDGQKAADAWLAQSARLHWDLGFENDALVFPLDERIGTRLGADDILISLPDGTKGPFGKDISALTIPKHWLSGVDLSGELTPRVASADGALHLALGDRRILYDSLGLHPL